MQKPSFTFSIEKFNRLLFIAVFSLVTIFFISRLWQPFVVNTNLKDLSPNLTDDPGLQKSLNWLSNNLEQRFILLLGSENEDDLFDASDLLSEELSGTGLVEKLDENIADELLQLYAQYPFNFLRSEDRETINQGRLKELEDATLKAIYSSGNAARLFPLLKDPFNFSGSFVLSLMENLSKETMNEEGIYVVEEKDKELYYQALVFSLSKGRLSLDAQEQIISKIESLKNKSSEDYPSVTIYRSGVIFYAADAAEKSKRDISTISFGSSIGIILLLWFAFRSLVPIVLPVVCITIGIAFAFTGTHLIFGSVHILTIVFGASLIGIVIDYALHYFYHWKNFSEPKAKGEQHIYRALLLSLFTSIIGYGALGISDLVSLKQISLFSCLGLVAAWSSILTLGPIFLNSNFSSKDKLFISVLKPLCSWVYFGNTYLRKLFFPALLVLFASAITLAYKASDSPKNLFTPPPKLIEQDLFISRIVNDYEPGRYFVISAQSTDELYKNLQVLLDSHPKAQKLSTLKNWLPSPSEQQNNYKIQSEIYRKNGPADTLLKRLGVEESTISASISNYQHQQGQTLTPKELFSSLGRSAPPVWTEIEETQYAFALVPKGVPAKEIASAIAGNKNIVFIDSVSSATEALKSQRISASTMLVFAYLLICVLLLLRYKTFTSLWMITIPLSSTFITLIILVTSGTEITLFHTMALFLVLGLGMDYVIFTAEIQRHPRSTILAVFLSTITSLLSFGLLALSGLAIVNAIGLTVLIGNTCNFIGTLALKNYKKLLTET